MINDKQVIYALIDRYVSRLTARFPMLNTLSPYISKTVCGYLEPYIDAFSSDGQLDTTQALAFATDEIQERIQKFKAQYEKEVPHEG